MTSQPINILETALAVSGGESQIITLEGSDISIRKNFTGAEVHELLYWVNAVTDSGEPMTLAEQMHGMYSLLSDSEPDVVKSYVEHLLEFRVGEIRHINSATLKIAGLVDDEGNFRFGV
ncbi:hypothetical protein WG936_05495 [Corynebacterium sp. H127]|uniref:hypothetical protein n=1 Tax=Corynebacterium sp. H127 TaxID=3133418 RepID=UPI00309711E4